MYIVFNISLISTLLIGTLFNDFANCTNITLCIYCIKRNFKLIFFLINRDIRYYHCIHRFGDLIAIDITTVDGSDEKYIFAIAKCINTLNTLTR